MMNLNLVHINDEHGEFPSELQDSQQEQMVSRTIEPIRAEHQYELDSSFGSHSQASGDREIVMDNSLDQSSLEHDRFLAMIKQQEIKTLKPEPGKQTNGQNYLMVNRSKIDITLLQTQSAEQSVIFSNSSATPIRMRFNQCPFQITSNKSPNYLLAEHLQVKIGAWETLQITFLIKPGSQQFGDIIESAVVTAEFEGREDSISPIHISFRVHYVTPRLRMSYQGNSEVLNLNRSQFPVVRLKANKLGMYEIQMSAIEGLRKMEMTVESRGKLTSLSERLVIEDGGEGLVKLRKRGHLTPGEKSALIFRPINCKICYVMGVELID